MTRLRQLAALCTTTAVLAVAGCAADEPGGKATGLSDQTFTAAEVVKATDGRVKTPLFAVPKDANLQLAFLNPGLTVPTFVEWKQGMEAAAAFYGAKVETSDLDLKYENAATAYQTAAVKSPVVVGSGAGAANQALVSQLKADDVPLVLIDQQLDGATGFGVDNQAAGKIGGQLLVDAAKRRVSTDWSGESVVYLGVSAASCEPCDTRVKAGAAVAGPALSIGEKARYFLTPDPGTADQAQTVVTDFLTAHPDDKIVILGFGDGAAVGSLNALKQAKRLDDAVVASLGGDPSGRAALRDPSNAKAFVGALDFNAYAQGWNWVEAAIATYLDKPFGSYQVRTVLTAANVDEHYPND